MNEFRKLLNQKELILLDSAMGTELQRLGYKTHLPLWTAPANEEVPDLVSKIHRDNIEAGADIITTNTFRTIRWTYSKINKTDKGKELTKKAVEIAQNAASKFQRRVLVAGSISTLEDCYEPEKVPPDEILMEEHTRQAELFKTLGVDIILIETINSQREWIATAKASSQTSLPFICSCVTDGNGYLLSKDPLKEAIDSIQAFNPEAIMLNCRPLEVIDNDFGRLCEYYDGYKGLYANGCGHPHEDLGWEFDESFDPQEKYLTYVRKWIDQGLKIIGGCCGTNPEYIHSIYNEFGM